MLLYFSIREAKIINSPIFSVNKLSTPVGLRPEFLNVILILFYLQLSKLLTLKKFFWFFRFIFAAHGREKTTNIIEYLQSVPEIRNPEYYHG